MPHGSEGLMTKNWLGSISAWIDVIVEYPVCLLV